MSSRFFKPFVGEKYNEGINGKKILVLGASFYCNKNGQNGQKNCPFFAECTDVVKKDSSKFDTTCPEYAGKNMKLSEEPSNAIDDRYPAYKRFAEFMQQFVSNKTEDVWDRMAFTDYLQFFSPTTQTKKEYLTPRDFDAFIETLRDLQPDVVISWGTVFLEKIREENNYVVDKDKLPDTDYYVCHMKGMPGVAKTVTLVSCFHPSSVKHWANDKEVFAKNLRLVLDAK